MYNSEIKHIKNFNDKVLQEYDVSFWTFKNHVSVYTCLVLTCVYIVLLLLTFTTLPRDPVTASVGLFVPISIWSKMVSYFGPIAALIVMAYLDKFLRRRLWSINLKVLLVFCVLFLTTMIIEFIFFGHFFSIEIFSKS